MLKTKVMITIVMFVLMGIAIREMRIPLSPQWEWIGRWSWGMDETIYTLQNMISFWGLVLVLIMLIRWEYAPKVHCESELSHERRRDSSPSLKGPDLATDISVKKPLIREIPKRSREEDEPSPLTRDGRDMREKTPFEIVNPKWKAVQLDKEKEKENA